MALEQQQRAEHSAVLASNHTASLVSAEAGRGSGGVACQARLAEQTSMIASLRQQLAAQAMALRSEALDV